MANNNRDQGGQYYGSNQDWDQNRRRSYNDDDYNTQNRENYGNMNRNRDYEDQNRGGYRNSGSSGYGDMRNVEYGDVYHGNVERRERETNQAQGGRENIYNQWNREREMNRGWGDRNQDYGSSGNFNRNREDYDRNWGNAGSNYGGYNSGRRDFGSYGEGNYGGQERRNYGNMSGRRGDRDWWDRTRDEVSSWFGDDDAERRRDRDRSVNGEHRGKGPKGYQRSDERIREDVHDRLYEDSYVDASDIEIKVENGEVVLTGNVPNREQKRRAEDVVESVSGVRNVENRIRINQGSTASYSSNQRDNDTSRTRHDNSANIGSNYTGTTNEVGNIGRESGTTNEIIRDTGNMKNKS